MINIHTPGLSLDTPDGGGESILATRPVAAIARVGPVARVERDAVAVLHNEYLPAASASLELSAVAQWLQRTLLTTSARDPAATIRATASLLSSTPGETQGQDLAQALRESVAQSGLFYESHLAAWAMQRYSEALLRLEPQAGWTRSVAMRDELPILTAIADDGVSGPPHGLGAEGPHPNAPSGGQPSVDMLRAQLQALESRQFSWQGELWPGQTAAMTIAEDGALPAGDHLPAWRTHLTLTLPELGLVNVDLWFDGANLKLALAAAEPRSVARLQEARADLVFALEGHTQTVASIGIRQS